MLSFAITATFTLPVLAARSIGWTTKMNPVPAETVGWPELVASVNGVWHGLPATQRASAVIFTGNYGEAGAINESRARRPPS